MNKVMLDLDDVVCDMSTELYKALTEHTGINIPVSQWNTFNLSRVYGFKPDTLFDVLKNGNVIERLKPFKDAKSSIDDLISLGVKVSIVTSRKELDPDGSITRAWLREFGISYDHLFITCHKEGKSTVAKSLRPVAVVDDSFENLIDCSPHASTSIVVDRPWNKGFTKTDIEGNFARVKCLKGVVEHVEGLLSTAPFIKGI